MAAPGGLRANAASWSAGGSGSGSGSAGGSGSGSGSGGSDALWLSLPKPAQRLPGALLDFLPQDNNDASASAAEARARAKHRWRL